MTDRRVARAAGPGAIVALAVLALGPVLFTRGFVLIGDMSFVPRQPWKASWLGLDGSVPRAVPADAFVAAATWLLPGDVVQKVVLFAALALAGLGMLRLVSAILGDSARVAPFGAAVLFLWNPWVLERLAIGHWGLLLGYAALPWVAQATLVYRRGPGGATLAAVVIPLGVAAFGSPTGGILAGLVAVVLVIGRASHRMTLGLVGAVMVVNLPWFLPGILGSAEPTDVAGVGAFAARSDSALGILGSVFSLGGIWKGAIVPSERDSVLLVAVAVVLVVVSLAYLVGSLRSARTDAAGRLLILAGIGLVLTLLPTFGVGADLVSWLVAEIPGAGILRDSQKWLALLALSSSVGFGLALDAAHRALRRAEVPARWIVALVAVLPVLLLPSFAWGIAGKLKPVAYPSEWTAVRTILEAQPAQSLSVVSLPFSAYQAYPWNDGRAALDPTLRFFPGDIVTNDVLEVEDGRVVAGEDPTAARIASALASAEPLAPVLALAGVRYVLVHVSAAGGARVDDAALVAAGTILHDGPELRLIDLGVGDRSEPRRYAAAVIAGDVLAAGAVLAALVMSVRQIGGKKDNAG